MKYSRSGYSVLSLQGTFFNPLGVPPTLLSEGYEHDGPGICLVDGQTEAGLKDRMQRPAAPVYAPIPDLRAFQFGQCKVFGGNQRGVHAPTDGARDAEPRYHYPPWFWLHKSMGLSNHQRLSLLPTGSNIGWLRTGAQSTRYPELFQVTVAPLGSRSEFWN